MWFCHKRGICFYHCGLRRNQRSLDIEPLAEMIIRDKVCHTCQQFSGGNLHPGGRVVQRLIPHSAATIITAKGEEYRQCASADYRNIYSENSPSANGTELGADGIHHIRSADRSSRKIERNAAPGAVFGFAAVTHSNTSLSLSAATVSNRNRRSYHQRICRIFQAQTTAAWLLPVSVPHRQCTDW